MQHTCLQSFNVRSVNLLVLINNLDRNSFCLCLINELQHTLLFKSLVSVIFLLFLKEVSSAHKVCINLIKNTAKLWNNYNFKKCFLCEYMLKCNLFLWLKLYFQHHYSSLQCHMIFRNHSNILICCSRNISDYYQCWKQLCCFIYLW